MKYTSSIPTEVELNFKAERYFYKKLLHFYLYTCNLIYTMDQKENAFFIRRAEFLILEINTYMYMYYRACVLVIRWDSINHILMYIVHSSPLLLCMLIMYKLLWPPYPDLFHIVANETEKKTRATIQMSTRLQQY